VECDAELLLGVATEVLLDEGGIEAVKAGGDCRVGGEEVSRSRDGQCHFEGCPVSFMKLRARSNTAKATCLHQVTDFRLDAECAEQPPSADPEQQFLLEAQFRPSS